ncbi:hypothetical protein KOY48_02280 [Candidatus Minimicrobia naudis]|uniref:Uncharacterized protein n=1 Tax=Candidatus Minimicrobia naudis TaxID=2841263 RepID=A0A8F1MCM3_9BACT|nr:hypothetical protein KOY48_02280 [Candidatus Minimicrobia naudis]
MTIRDSDMASFAALIAHETSGGNITGRAILAEADPAKKYENSGSYGVFVGA